jgi:hypothetical protein
MKCWYLCCFIAILATSAFAGVTVTKPTSGATVGSPVNYVASATTSCSKGVASMGIYIDDVLTYVVNGASLNTNLSFNPGTYSTVVEEWDYCGGASYTPITITVTGKTGVWVTSPVNKSTVTSPVNYIATATDTTCSKGVASMGIYVNNALQYVVNGASMNTTLSLNPGTYNTVVEEWNYCGGASYTSMTITVSGTTEPTLKNLQASGGWVGYGELPPNYQICTSCGPGVTWSMQQHIASPSLSGNSSQFNIGGTTPYADVLWTNPLIGQNSSQGLPDSNHTLLPTLHNFTYDAYFYSSNLSLSEVMEFDISMYFDGLSLIWGNQCTIAAGNEWEIWNNADAKWVSTGFSCNPISNGWNHVTIQVQRESDNWLLFQSITLNGVTNTINQYYAPGSAPSGWWGITVNYQMDGNYKQSPYTTYLDNFSFTYW